MLQFVRVFGEDSDTIVAVNDSYINNLAANYEVVDVEALEDTPDLGREYYELVKLCREYL